MIDLVTQKQGAIAVYCRRLNVRHLLEVFGSAARGTFDPETSDLDFIVEFNDREGLDRPGHYLALADSLKTLFNKKVDLIEAEARSFRNPYFRASVEKEKEVVYAT
jgi:predicted nucleotidyltransferase